MPDKRENYRRALAAEGATPEEIAEALAEVEAEEEARGPNGRARRAGIPPLYVGASFADLDLDQRREAIMAARNWSVAITTEDEGELAERQRRRDPIILQPGLLQKLAAGDFSAPIPRGLYLWSDGADGGEDETGFGTGKTEVAAAVAEYVLATGKLKVRWLDIVRAMTDLNLPFKHPMYSRAAERLRPPEDDELLVLDDIDKQPPTDRNIQPIFALVNDCVNNEAPLLITANRHPDDLAADWGQRFGHAAASRIIAHCLDIEVTGRDRRLDGTVMA